MDARTIPTAALRIRRITAVDIAPLADLWVDSWRETLPEIDFAARRPWIVDLLGDGANLTLVAEAGAPRGFVSTAGRVLHQLVVASADKGRGIAQALVAAAKARAPGGLDLEVNRDNRRAVRFYLREGFAVAGHGANATSGLPILRMTWPDPEAGRRDS